MREDPTALVPELALLFGALLGLLLGLFLPRRRQWLVTGVALAAIGTGVVATAVQLAGPGRLVFGYSYAIDPGLGAARLVVLLSTLLALCLARPTIAGAARETEFVVLLLLGALGSVALAGASDLLVLGAAYLLASVPLYALVGFAKDAAGTEAGLKYYLLGAFLGIAMLTGTTVLYGVGGATAYRDLQPGLAGAPVAAVAVGSVAVLAGLAFKAGAVPAHFWVPDVAQGSTAPVAAFVTTVPKVGALVAAYRLVAEALPTTVDWPLLVALLAVGSMTLGNLAAFVQDDVRRLLGYSTVSQVGYLLLAVAVAVRADLALSALLVYLAAYAVTNLGAFAVVCALPRAPAIGDWSGLFRRRPWLALSLVVCLLGLVGTPPTAVFVGKLAVFSAAVQGGYGWLAGVAAVNTVASVFYYLRWVAPMFTREPTQGRADAFVLASVWPAVGAYAAALGAVAFGVAAAAGFTVGSGPLLS